MGRPKFYQLETVTTITYKPSLVRIDACNFEFFTVITDPQTNKPTDTQDRLQYTVPQLSTQCNEQTNERTKQPTNQPIDQVLDCGPLYKEF